MKKIGLQIGSHKLRTIEKIINARKYLTQDFIFKKVCEHLKLRQNDVKQANRTDRARVEARQLTMFLTREKLVLTFFNIGVFFGKDHATAMHACKTIKNLIETNREFRGKNGEFIDSILNL